MRLVNHQIHLAVLLRMLTLSQLTLAEDPPKIERLIPAGGQRGTTVDVKLPGKPGDGELKVWSSNNRLSLEISEKKDTAKVTVPDDATFGQHWYRFYNEHGTTDLLPFVVGSISESIEAEPNNKLSNGQPIDELPCTINGVLEKAGDTDIYTVNLKESDTLIASIDANESLGAPVDCVLQLLNSQGTVIAQNDDVHGFDPQIVFQVTRAGTYHLRTFGFPATPNSTVKLAGAASHIYRLTITTGPFVDHCVPMQVNRNRKNTVALRGWNLNPEQSSLTIPPFASSTITSGEHSARPFTVPGVDIPTVAETTNSPQGIEVPSSVTGTISQPKEQDIYTFDGKKDQKLTVSVVSRTLKSPLDPIITIDTADGKRVKEVDDRSRNDLDAEAAIKLPRDGQYHITVKDLFENGGERFVYVLTVTETQPDFSLTLKANTYVIEREKELEIPVTVNRTNGFAEKITVVVKDLPEGLNAGAVHSEGKGDTAKSVTLKIKRDETAAAFSGIVQITGTSAEGKLLSTAEAPIQNSKATTTNIWLTVPPAPPQKEKTDAEKENPES